MQFSASTVTNKYTHTHMQNPCACIPLLHVTLGLASELLFKIISLFGKGVTCSYLKEPPFFKPSGYWAVQWSWFARVNALCNLSRKMSREVAASLPGRFLSRHCFTLCITMEVEPRTAKQYKCHHCCSCKMYWVKGMEGAFFVCFCIIFWLTRRSQDRGKGHPIAQATSYCLLPDTFWLRASKNAFKVGSVKFTVTAFHCEERMHQK